ncbi:MAG: restriction endonuclease [Prevotellaceae bacterium]|jgi:restriction system protein|nr:restriction endonuclease [Prevotellaceae bacterium]
MKQRTIIEAISKVLKDKGKPLSIKDIYDQIIDKSYYKFKAQNPYSVVRVEVRRHCVGVDIPSASRKKYFQIHKDGTYSLLSSSKDLPNTTKQLKETETDENKQIVKLKEIHLQCTNSFKRKLLNQLKEIEPDTFELFCKKLLKVYGFKDLKVTRPKRDGGIDGYGKLKVGISYLNVAVQCKRWKNATVGRTEIDKFRGAIQGDYEQGIFLTTSQFSKEALNATTKKGAVPIILIDGMMIVDIMIEKKFGIEIEEIPIYINALDVILGDD